VITVVSVAGLVSIQDAGRPGWMHEGVPRGGPLAPELLERANAAAGNPPGEAAVEIVGAASFAVAPGTSVATDEGPCTTAGGLVRASSRERGVAYLAIRGGVDVPLVLGGRGTLLGAALGGFGGRPLRAGDVLRSRGVPPEQITPPPRPDPLAALPIVAGPDLDRFAPHALDVLLASAFVVGPRSDRTGVRLAGAVLPRSGRDDTGPSAPMFRGAIQVPPSGEPIVLGPDHPTTGGYPVLATLVRRGWGPLACRIPGAPVHFALAR
jgi:allophanate hydrolase subunit 2